MKTKALKMLSTVLMVMFRVASFSQVAFANSNSSAAGIAGGITPNTAGIDATNLTAMAGKVLGLIQIASAVLAVILIAVFGFKFILGSANEKADYQKSFIPLIVGIVVVFAATIIRNYGIKNTHFMINFFIKCVFFYCFML